MPFLTRMDVVHLEGTPNWVLDADLVWADVRGHRLTAPEGMSTDLYSIPGPLRGLLYRSQKYVEAAVMHDAAYRGLLQGGSGTSRRGCRLARAEADRLLLDILEEQGAPWTLRSAIYAGVRVGGWMSYRGTR